MTFYIDQYENYPSFTLVQTFNEFSDSVTLAGSVNCGDRKYDLSWSDNSIQTVVTIISPRDISITTQDMSLVGEYEIYISISLNDFP